MISSPHFSCKVNEFHNSECTNKQISSSYERSHESDHTAPVKSEARRVRYEQRRRSGESASQVRPLDSCRLSIADDRSGSKYESVEVREHIQNSKNRSVQFMKPFISSCFVRGPSAKSWTRWRKTSPGQRTTSDALSSASSACRSFSIR